MSTPVSNSPDRFRRVWALLFGALLGLAVLKFGNPVVLDRQIPAPLSLNEAISQPWPLRWSFGLFAVLALAGGPLLLTGLRPLLRRLPAGLWVSLIVWVGWQFIAASRSVDGSLTALTLPHFVGVLAAYFFGIVVLGDTRYLPWALAGLLVGLCICLMRANTQRLVEFPSDRAILLEGERTGWTNFPPAMIATMKQEGTIVNTNGVDRANPLILSKLERGRVHGTLVYPNALAGIVLLLLPAAWQRVASLTSGQRRTIRYLALGLLGYLGVTALLWSGSKSGWLIALVAGVVALLHLNLPRRFQAGLLGTLVIGGLMLFALRFQGYFAAGATSVGARFDYWRAAGQTTLAHPIMGTGPGTFQRPYAQRKSPDAEMARLAHNDYLEQFSDSGVIGGLAYLWWAASWSWGAGRWAWRQSDGLWFAMFLGVAAWMVQGLSEFGLYLPALAWTAFALAGAVVGAKARETIPIATPARSGLAHA